MFILLLVLLAVAVLLIVAGLVLSPRYQEPRLSQSEKVAPRRAATYGYPTQRYRERAGYGQRVVGINRQARVRRSTVEVERQVFAGVLSSMNVGRLFGRAKPGAPTPWAGIGLILIALVCFLLISLRTLFPGSAILIGMTSPDTSTLATPVANTSINAPSQPVFPSSGASNAILRVNQLDPAQYKTTQEYSTWADSACSAASMTEVLNAYDTNHAHYRITDILNVEAGLHQITPELGMLAPTGIDITMARFGFTSTHLKNPSIDDMIKIARNGNPVIINFPPDRWAGGHLLVLNGGDNKSVYLTDSSSLDMRVMARTVFMKYWAGFAVVAVPNK